MKWMGIYLLGYTLLVVGVLLALWKSGVLASVAPIWIAIGLVIAFGIGIMIAVTSSSDRKTIEIDRG
ncbi:MAG: hypothetical protein ACYDC8_10985 [Gammaproteobacteria bacterium]